MAKLDYGENVGGVGGSVGAHLQSPPTRDMLVAKVWAQARDRFKLMSTSPETDFDLELHFLPAWAKKAPSEDRYEHFTGEGERPDRSRGPRGEKGRRREDQPRRRREDQ